MIDRVTNTVAAGAVFSPWWMPSLSELSQTAALLLPILGVIWLAVQIIAKIVSRR